MSKEQVLPLTIFNASAGSGKTYRLVKEYIELLIGNERRADSFAHIIAMTFTNKAANEMKERIIKELDQISSPKVFQGKSDALTKELATAIGVSASTVVERSKKVLKLILHQYEDFHIMTIDKFNLRLIKSFGRDLDLPVDFEVVLNEESLIERIVDDLFNQLGEAGNRDLNKLIFRYAKSNISDGSSWDFRRELIRFGAVLKNEKNNQLVERLIIMDFSVEQFGRLQHHKKSIDAQFQMKNEALRSILEANSYDFTQIIGGKNTSNDLSKIISYSEFPVVPSIIGKRLSTNMEKEEGGGKHFPSEIRSALESLEKYWESELEDYASLKLFLKNFFNMALLQHMAGALKRIEKEEQIIRISEFNTLISSLIQNENAPFIYERLGTRYRHFLLDEFQDTSRLQWLNLVPLVHNSISENHENLIVGDPKQSIYRFKNGIAEQFVALPRIYNPENDPKIAQHSDYFAQMGQVIELEDNWRSSPSIVHLNNLFFDQLREKLPEVSAPFYKSVFQNPKSSLNGRIQISSQEESLSSAELVPKLKAWIDECLSEGYNPGDICILGGRNKDCNIWAVHLTELGYKVVSSDSLLIHSNLRVKLSIAYLQLRLVPSGENEMKRFAELYFRAQNDSFNAYNQYVVELEMANGKRYRKFDSDAFLTDHFGSYNSFFFKHESLYDLIQSFYRLLGYDELSDPYLHHLADVIFEFGQKRGPDLKTFLDDYFATKDKIAVQIPESKDAVKVMTIHKSKGLEFPVVLIPSMDFDLSIKSTFLLESDDYILYKKPSKDDVLSILQEARAAEEAQVLTDKVNQCYVAMTRPIERLYINNSYQKSSFGRIFDDVLRLIEGVSDSDSQLLYETNDGLRSERSADEDIPLITPLRIQDNLWFPDISLQDRPELGDSNYLSEEMQFGVQFHLLMSRIDSPDAIESELSTAIDAGEVAVENRVSLKEKLTTLLNRKEYANLFSGHTKILSEQAIILTQSEIARPDKIIVKPEETILLDFKTGIPSAKDEKQINAYRETLESMGYPKVSSYLFYTATNELRLVGQDFFS